MRYGGINGLGLYERRGWHQAIDVTIPDDNCVRTGFESYFWQRRRCRTIFFFVSSLAVELLVDMIGVDGHELDLAGFAVGLGIRHFRRWSLDRRVAMRVQMFF